MLEHNPHNLEGRGMMNVFGMSWSKNSNLYQPNSFAPPEKIARYRHMHSIFHKSYQINKMRARSHRIYECKHISETKIGCTTSIHHREHTSNFHHIFMCFLIVSFLHHHLPSPGNWSQCFYGVSNFFGLNRTHLVTIWPSWSPCSH